MTHYQTAAVSKATDTPILKLQRYFERSHIRLQPCDLPSRGSGENRGYSMRRIRQVGITTELTWLGIGPSRAAEAAFLFSDQGNPGREVGELFPLGRTMLVGFHRGENKVVNVLPDESLDTILEQNNAAFIVDVGRILTKINSKMEPK